MIVVPGRYSLRPYWEYNYSEVVTIIKLLFTTCVVYCCCATKLLVIVVQKVYSITSVLLALNSNLINRLQLMQRCNPITGKVTQRMVPLG